MAETLIGTVEIKDAGAIENTTITLDGDTADVSAGGHGHDGAIILRDNAGNERVRLNGQMGDVLIKNVPGDDVFQVSGAGGDVSVYRGEHL